MSLLRNACVYGAWLLCVVSSPVTGAPQYLITDLGTNAVPMAINDFGDVAGYRFNNGLRDAMLYTNGVLTNLVIQASTNCGFSGINNSGNVVGWYQTLSSSFQHFVITNSVFLNLAVPDVWGGSYSTPLVNPGAYSINDSNQIAGSRVASNSPSDIHFRGYVITNLADRRITSFSVGTSDTLATRITPAGAVSGFSTVAFLYTNTGMLMVPTASTNSTYAYGVNDSNQLAVITTALFYSPVNSPTGSVYATQSGKFSGMGRISSTYPFAAPYSINNYTQAVGIAFTNPTAGGPHAFVYEPLDGIQDLNSLIDPASGWTLTEARAINDAGQIIGRGITNGTPHGYLLTPALIFDPKSVSVRGCTVTFRIRGLTGVSATIQAADDCLSWFDLATITLSSTGTTYTDTSVCDYPSRCYRVFIP